MTIDKQIYKYEDLHPKHEVWKLAEYWGEEGRELVTDTDIDDAIEDILDDCTVPVEEWGDLEIFGFAPYPECNEYDLPEEGEPIIETCSVVVNVLEWTKKNRPHWLDTGEGEG